MSSSTSRYRSMGACPPPLSARGAWAALASEYLPTQETGGGKASAPQVVYPEATRQTSARVAKGQGPQRERHDLLGCPVDALTQREVLDRIATYVDSREPHHVITVNPEYVMRAHHD